MARSDPTIYMRIPAELKEKLDAAAAGNRRSATAEVVARLQASFEEATETPRERLLAVALDDANRAIQELSGPPAGPGREKVNLAQLYDLALQMRKDLREQQAFINRLVGQGYTVRVDKRGILGAEGLFKADREPDGPSITIRRPKVPPPTEGGDAPQPSPNARKRPPKKA